MLERQINEAPPNWHNGTIIAAGHGLTGEFERCCVRGVGLRRIAEQIARQLVQQQNQS